MPAAVLLSVTQPVLCTNGESVIFVLTSMSAVIHGHAVRAACFFMSGAAAVLFFSSLSDRAKASSPLPPFLYKERSLLISLFPKPDSG